MKSNQKLLATLVATVTLFSAIGLISACASSSKDTTVALDQKQITLKVGETYQLTFTTNPTDAMDKSVTWKSSNDAVATVTQGQVTAIGEGQAVITLSSGSAVDSCKVTVQSFVNNSSSGSSSSSSSSSSISGSSSSSSSSSGGTSGSDPVSNGI